MSLEIERIIDLTLSDNNPAPKRVSQLSIIHEANDGELVQYYIEPQSRTQGDKSTCAVGVYDKETDSYSYCDYPDAEWSSPGQRICGNRLESLGVKAFPSIGAIAFYRLAYRKITRIAAPVNRRDSRSYAPELAAVVNADGTTTFTITPPSRPEYECYRIVMQNGIYTEEYITYDPELTVPVPEVSGDYVCYAVGYGEEGQLLSKESNAVTLSLTGKNKKYKRPYYMRSEISEIEEETVDLDERVTALEQGGGGGGGTSDYDDLENKPQIMGVTLEGNKTFTQLNLEAITNAEIDAIVEA